MPTALFLAALAALPLRVAGPTPGHVEIGVASALEKLRPADAPPRARRIDLAAARGECESAQVAVSARRRLAALVAEAPPLRGPGEIPVALYRVATVRLARASGPDGEAGEWPDPLVPVRDPFFGEERRAFPVPVEPGRLQSIWVEVCVPATARAGSYRGAVRLLDGSSVLGSVPVALRVWPITLARSGGFVAAFGLSTRLGTRALGVPGDRTVARALAAAALRHRVTPFVLSADPPDGACTARECALDWSRYDAEVGPVLDGTLVPGVRGGFAEVRTSGRVWSGPEDDLAATLRAWRSHFEEKGWADRLWLYTLDEPSPGQLPELRRRARVARSAGVRVLATAAPTPELLGAVDAFVPNLVALPEGERPRRVMWSYTSCLSHGCAEIPASGPMRASMLREFAGWPGYEIDRPGAAAMAVSLLGSSRGLAGELYYDMLHAWIGDPWTDVRAFAGNGDGTLLYPGLPAALGGSHPFPVESVRLKIVRDALEDVELLSMARAAGEGALARRFFGRLVPSARGWERRAGPWLVARRALGDALASRAARAAR